MLLGFMTKKVSVRLDKVLVQPRKMDIKFLFVSMNIIKRDSSLKMNCGRTTERIAPFLSGKRRFKNRSQLR
jgi:hypothetical protein